MHGNPRILKRIIEKGRSYIPTFFLLSGMETIVVPIELYGLLLSRRLIDQGFLLQNWPTIQGIILILIGLFILRSLISYGTALLSTSVHLRMNQRFQDEVFAHLLRLPVPFFAQEPTGRLMSRILDDATLFSTILNHLFRHILLDPLKLLFLTLLLAYFNVRLCMIMVISSLVSSLVIRWMGRWLPHISKGIQEKNAAIYSYVEQVISNIELIKSRITEKQEAARFHNLIEELIELALKPLKISIVAQPILQVVKYATIGIIFISGSWMVSKDVLTIGTLILFIGGTYLFFSILHIFGNTYGSMNENLARMEALFSILDTPPETSVHTLQDTIHPHIRCIEFDRVSFSYIQCRPVLDDVTFSIQEGETLGITGKSGSGKTTLIRLLLRFYEPGNGDVRINGESIRRFDLESLRHSMGIVFQENLIFNDSIRNNIEYGLAGICSEKIIRAATVCCASDFIRAMPNRYDTVIGEQGKRLSGGERQRLAIARALAAGPAILILDEGTSFLEIEQERIILKRIKEMRKGRITIIISQRLSAMESVDRALTLDNGRIIETHPSLLAVAQTPVS